MARRIPSGIILAFILLISHMTQEVQSTFVADDGNGKIFDPQVATKLLSALKKVLPKTPFSILEKTANFLISKPSNIIDIGNFALNEIFPLAIKYGLEKILEEPKDEKSEKLVKYFDRIFAEQKKLEEEIESLQQDILKLGLAVSYAHSERAIKGSLSLLRRSLEKPDDQHIRDEFYKASAKIPNQVDNILDGLLGRNTFSKNILSALRDINHCHGRKLSEKVFTLMTIVMTGVDVYKQFVQMKNPNQNEPFGQSKFAQTLRESVDEVTKRLEDMVQECLMDERAVENEMRDIINQYSDESKKDLANALFNFLEDKYDTKEWFVLAFGDEYRKSGQLKTVQTGGFHTVSANGVFALAVSYSGKKALLSPKQRSYLEEFKIPYNDELVNNNFINKFPITASLNVELIHDYFGLYLTPLRTDKRFDVEFLVYSYEDCREKVPPSYGYHVWSEDSEHFFLTHTSCPEDSILPTYLTTEVFVVPRRSSWSSWKSAYLPIPNTNWNCFVKGGEWHVFRNEFYGYHGDDSEGVYTIPSSIIAPIKWYKLEGRFLKLQSQTFLQEWQFDTCLVIGIYPQGGFLIHADCITNYGSAQNKWIRHGLQIVAFYGSGEFLCLTVEEFFIFGFTPLMKLCSLNPKFLWKHWDVSCEDDTVVHGVPSKSNGRPLRNELSLRYLGAQDDQVKHGPWMNLPGQRWRFVDGQLMNDDGVCLIIGDDNRSLLKKNCAEAKKLLIHSHWEYNEKRQIVSHHHDGEHGYCLTANKFIERPGIITSFADALVSSVFHLVLHLIHGAVDEFSSSESGVHISVCKDVPEQKWGGYFKTVTDYTEIE